MKKDELIKLIKEMIFNEKDVFISCQPEVSSFDMVNGEGIEIIQYETLISIKHQEITRKYTKIGSMKIYEDEELKEEEKKIPEKLSTWFSVETKQIMI